LALYKFIYLHYFTLISEELAHVSHWADEHNLRLNVEKSVEVIVHQPQKREFKSPQPTSNISRKSHITVLGVVIGSNLKFGIFVALEPRKCIW